jgi:hypothetical protein
MTGVSKLTLEVESYIISLRFLTALWVRALSKGEALMLALEVSTPIGGR